mmetsp:Transcript_8261/g.37628  ORF Transcript_8261/g.37628 Transcript_8261/m.37628 type:complete len:232 (+) Transcript_8261:300-995(+)
MTYRRSRAGTTGTGCSGRNRRTSPPSSATSRRTPATDTTTKKTTTKKTTRTTIRMRGWTRTSHPTTRTTRAVDGGGPSGAGPRNDRGTAAKSTPSRRSARRWPRRWRWRRSEPRKPRNPTRKRHLLRRRGRSDNGAERRTRSAGPRRSRHPRRRSIPTTRSHGPTSARRVSTRGRTPPCPGCGEAWIYSPASARASNIYEPRSGERRRGTPCGSGRRNATTCAGSRCSRRT